MRTLDVLRTTAFRWSAAAAGTFAALSLLLFGFVYWQTAGYEAGELDAAARDEAGAIARAAPGAAAAQLEAWIAADEHHVRYGLLLDRGGARLAGNVASLPPGVPLDGRPRLVTGLDIVGSAADDDGDERDEAMRGLATRLPDGGTLLLGLDTDELEHTEAVLLRALTLGLAPMVALSLLAGTILGRRALRRVAAMDRAIAGIVGGDIAGRLPVGGGGDEFDRLARSVNAMLGDLERLFEEVRGVGDSIAHDLRTPLTRARVRLERSRDAVRSEAGFRAAIDETIRWLDGTLALIAAILRIGEVEHGRRRAGFGRVELSPLLREAADLYEPVAEEKGVALAVDVDARADVLGDRDLLLEALANLVDNAVKFSPPGATCTLRLGVEDGTATVAVLDEGPGIPASERADVLKRFHRSERSRSTEGNGLGLALVAAIVRLHGFELRIGGGPGCAVEIRAPSAPTETMPASSSYVALAREESDMSGPVEALSAPQAMASFDPDRLIPTVGNFDTPPIGGS